MLYTTPPLTPSPSLQGWRDVLQRYHDGGGVIYDYEFLHNPDGKNVGAGMSPFAGFVGCAVVCMSCSYNPVVCICTICLNLVYMHCSVLIHSLILFPSTLQLTCCAHTYYYTTVVGLARMVCPALGT